jgi:hypothetical protein
MERRSHSTYTVNMTSALVILVLAAAMAPAAESQFHNPLTRETYESIYDYMESSYYVENEYLIPTALRLSFHDCTGGCDGCINMAQPPNGGLARIVWALESVYTENNFDTVMSRGDFWALSAFAAVGAAINNANARCRGGPNSYCQVPRLSATFKWGRPSCNSPNAPDTNDVNEFALATFTADEVYDYFFRTFGLSENQVAAVMGAHTLGAAHRNESGFDGKWVVGGATSFDNRYYQLMLDDSRKTLWTNADKATAFQNLTDRRWQYDGTDPQTNAKKGFMLNSDFAIFYNLRPNEAGQATCDVQANLATCTPSATFNKAAEYASDVVTWVADFSVALTLMLSNTGTAPLYHLDEPISAGSFRQGPPSQRFQEPQQQRFQQQRFSDPQLQQFQQPPLQFGFAPQRQSRFEFDGRTPADTRRAPPPSQSRFSEPFGVRANDRNSAVGAPGGSFAFFFNKDQPEVQYQLNTDF